MKDIKVETHFFNAWTDPDSKDSFILFSLSGIRSAGEVRVGVTVCDLAFDLAFFWDVA
jgi:hypothetical protein